MLSFSHQIVRWQTNLNWKRAAQSIIFEHKKNFSIRYSHLDKNMLIELKSSKC